MNIKDAAAFFYLEFIKIRIAIVSEHAHLYLLKHMITNRLKENENAQTHSVMTAEL